MGRPEHVSDSGAGRDGQLLQTEKREASRRSHDNRANPIPVQKILSKNSETATSEKERIKPSEQKFRDPINHFADIIMFQIITSSDGTKRFTDISHLVEKINEVKRDGVLADAGIIYNQVLPEYREKSKKAEEQASKNMSGFQIEVPCHLLSGCIWWLQYISSPRSLAGLPNYVGWNWNEHYRA